MESLVELFCDIDDFCQDFMPIFERNIVESGIIKRRRARSLAVSEVMTILIHFHQSHYHNFKAYYCSMSRSIWGVSFLAWSAISAL
jgi:hypothetical protein